MSSGGKGFDRTEKNLVLSEKFRPRWVEISLQKEAGASLVSQKVKNLPAMRETSVLFLSWEYPLEEGMATHSSILAWRIPWAEEPGEYYIAHVVAKSQTRLSTYTHWIM